MGKMEKSVTAIRAAKHPKKLSASRVWKHCHAQLHNMSEAPQVGYGQCSYLRRKNSLF